MADAAGFIELLLVEDSPADARLAREAFHDVNPSIRIHHVSDGVEAMAFLRRDGAYAHVPPPDFILLDLNLPKMDGREVLALIKKDENLRTIPTVVLSSSEAEMDVLICYQLQANCYLKKPAQWDAFDSIVRSINAFWLARASSPQSVQDEPV